MAKIETATLAIDTLTTNKVQPPDRTEPRKMVEMVHSVRKNGIMSPPLIALIADIYVVIDGHRRLAVWQALGNATATCQVVKAASEAEAQALFAEINKAALKLSSADYLYQWAMADDRDAQLAAMGSKAGHVRSFVKLFGVETAAKYGKTGKVSPSIASHVPKIQRVLATLTKDVPDPKQIGHWLIKHKQTIQTNHICRHGTNKQARELLAAIRNGRPLAQDELRAA